MSIFNALPRKMQKASYRTEKKRVAAELVQVFRDPTVVVMADWLKIRGTLKKWTKMYCVLKPGILLIYKSAKTHKHGYWVGTVLLSSCNLIERPSKKDGFCFKLFHPLDQSIWATRITRLVLSYKTCGRLPGFNAPATRTSPKPFVWLDKSGLSWGLGRPLGSRTWRENGHGRDFPKETYPKYDQQKGPRGEALGAVTQPLPSSYLICRAGSEESGRCWMDALELSLKCSSLLMRTMNKLSDNREGGAGESGRKGDESGRTRLGSSESETTKQDLMTLDGANHSPPIINESEAEKHFREMEAHPGEEEGTTESDEEIADDLEIDDGDGTAGGGEQREETPYIPSPPEVFGALGEGEQTEEIEDENKSLIWTLMKQVRPGMDLSKVVLPTFILEPRSFLEKLADYYYHSDIIAQAVRQEDPFQRMKSVVKFYLSGFYKKPKGLKKPYNPILGEVFRCYWEHPRPEDGRTFYIAEQVSHHPPISAFHVSNRQSGFNVCGTILAKSKFYGNSLSAIMMGNARVTLLSRGENYVASMPYAHCKGLILGTLTMELGGQVTITCDRTGYTCELEFRLKPFLGGADAMNSVTGKIKLGRQVLADIDGHWDGLIYITEKATGVTVKKGIFWHADQEVIKQRLKRYTVPVSSQEANESEKMWCKVSAAIAACDQVGATEEKTVLEEAQRKRAKELKEASAVHAPELFTYDAPTNTWLYKHADYRPWDHLTDLIQSESKMIVFTRSRHKTPLVRSSSLAGSASAGTTLVDVAGVAGGVGIVVEGEDSSEDDAFNLVAAVPVTTAPTAKLRGTAAGGKGGGKVAMIGGVSQRDLDDALRPINANLDALNNRISQIQISMSKEDRDSAGGGGSMRSMVTVLAIFLCLHAVLLSYLLNKHIAPLRNQHQSPPT